MGMFFQNLIHKLEMGGGQRTMRWLLAFIAVVSLAVVYNLTSFRNLATPEAMDAAQLARNLGDGRGYATDFIRPLSLYLMQRKSHDALEKLPKPTDAASAEARHKEVARLLRLEDHPDLANAPLYPVLLAGWLKLNPFGYPDVSEQDRFSIYTPDLWIAMLNQLLLVIAAALLFGIARRLFDEPVAWGAAIVFVGSDLFWRFSVSGLPTMLGIVVVLALVSAVARMELAAKSNDRAAGWFVGMAAMSGVFAGLAFLNIYSLGLLIVPVAFALGTLPGQKRGGPTTVAIVAFLLVAAPWVTRNVLASGTPFGTAGYAIWHGTAQFPDHELGRSLDPDFGEVVLRDFWNKLIANAKELLSSDWPKLGGSWVAAFFLVSLLVPFRNPALRRMRAFTLGSLALLTAAQALGRTTLTTDSPDVNSENLLAVLAPVAFVFGVGMFFIMLDQLQLVTIGVRYSVQGTFYAVLSAPLLFSLLHPQPSAVVYPPYFPPWIQDKAKLVDQRGWIMSDMPWAVAWYGRRPGVWLTLKFRDVENARARNDFFVLHDFVRPVRALYLSAKALEKVRTRPVWDWLQRDDPAANWETFVHDWEAFAWLGVFLKGEVPSGFPLKKAPRPVLPELFLTDSERERPKTIQSP